MIESVVANVTHHPDYFHPIVRSLRQYKVGAFKLEHRTANALTNRILIGKILFHERLIHQGDVCGAGHFRVTEDPATHEGHLKGRKFLRAHQRHDGLSAGQSRLAPEVNRGIESTEGRKPGRRDTHTLHARYFRYRMANRLAGVEPRLPGRIGALWRSNVQVENVFR